MIKGFLLGLLTLCALAATQAADPTYLWVEGEHPTTQRIAENPMMADVNPMETSGGAWICSFAPDGKPTGQVDYVLDIATTAHYHLWVRAAVCTGLPYRVDGGAWTPIDDVTGVDRQRMAPDGNWFWPPQTAWYHLAPLELTAGKHTLSFQLGGETAKDRFAALDCFLLTTGPFTPHGKYKPDESAPAPITFHPGKTWDFTPPSDTLDPAALLDLRYLNEQTAARTQR